MLFIKRPEAFVKALRTLVAASGTFVTALNLFVAAFSFLAVAAGSFVAAFSLNVVALHAVVVWMNNVMGANVRKGIKP